MSNTEALKLADIERMAREAMDYEQDGRGRVTFSCDIYGAIRFARLVSDAIAESTHPADASKSGAQIDMAVSGEPVAWMWAPSEAWPSDYVMTCYKPRAELAAKNGMKVQPLYAAPHPAPARVPLPAAPTAQQEPKP